MKNWHQKSKLGDKNDACGQKRSWTSFKRYDRSFKIKIFINLEIGNQGHQVQKGSECHSSVRSTLCRFFSLYTFTLLRKKLLEKKRCYILDLNSSFVPHNLNVLLLSLMSFDLVDLVSYFIEGSKSWSRLTLGKP